MTLLRSLFIFLCLGTLLHSRAAFAEQESDEFEITEPAFEVNSSKDSINPDNQNDLIDVPETSPFANPSDEAQKHSEPAFDLNSPQGSEQLSGKTIRENQEDTIMVRERVEPASPPPNPDGDYVEFRIPQDVFLPYKQRQKRWGFLFSVGGEQVAFPGLQTQVGVNTNGDDYTFDEMFGKHGIQAFSAELGPKFNTRFGSFALLGGITTLDKKDPRIGRHSADFYAGVGDRSNQSSTVGYTRYQVMMNYYLDMLFKEPYIVPYVGGGFWQADYRETSTAYKGEVATYTTDPGIMWKFGALINIDWLEADNARMARKRTGMQGTFINIYAVSTQMTENTKDTVDSDGNILSRPDVSEDMDIGAGLVIEF